MMEIDYKYFKSLFEAKLSELEMSEWLNYNWCLDYANQLTKIINSLQRLEELENEE